MSTIHLQQIMKEIPSYLKDTSDVISKISNHNIPKESVFVTLHVKSLYTRRNSSCQKNPRTPQHKTVPTPRSQLLFSTYFDLKQFEILLTNKSVQWVLSVRQLMQISLRFTSKRYSFTH